VSKCPEVVIGKIFKGNAMSKQRHQRPENKPKLSVHQTVFHVTFGGGGKPRFGGQLPSANAGEKTRSP